MWFGSVAVADAKGAVLAHAVRAPGIAFKKGRLLTAGDRQALAEAGIESVVVARLSAGDRSENDAAAALAQAAAGDGLEVADAFTGRANLVACENGILVIDEARVQALNEIDETVTLASLAPFAVVRRGQMVATIKIIPFAVPESTLEACLAVIGEQPLARLAPFRQPRVRLVQTVLPSVAPKVLDKTRRITADRVAALGGTLVAEGQCPHRADDLAAMLRPLPRDWDMLLIVGASAITDRRDVLPAAVEAVGGRNLHLGMPVDPGNLLLLAEIDGRPVLGLPGCARSPAPNGFDWVVQRLAAGLAVTGKDIQRMGVGGLLVEVPTRPQPRDARRGPAAAPAPRLAALILAAGSSRRMGQRNKLLIEVGGVAMVRRIAAAAREAGLDPITVVTGHQHAAVEAVLHGLPVQLVHNPDHADGLSTSLRAGIEVLDDKVDGAVVCLGDMPRVERSHLERLVAAFAPEDGRAVVVPTHRGRRGNPVIWAKRFFPEMQALEGDVGARPLLARHHSLVHEVEMEDAATLLDVDTPAALAALEKEPA